MSQPIPKRLRSAGRLLTIFACIAAATAARSSADNFRNKQIDDRVAALLAQMTFAEKVGQLVQLSSRRATGPASTQQSTEEELLSKDGLGSILNLTGAKPINAMQQLALDRSRLKVPLLFGLDVIH